MNVYRYYFVDHDDPVSIVAKSKAQARKTLEFIIPKLPDGYDLSSIAKETTERLVEGVTTITNKSGTKVYVGAGKWEKKGFKHE